MDGTGLLRGPGHMPCELDIFLETSARLIKKIGNERYMQAYMM